MAISTTIWIILIVLAALQLLLMAVAILDWNKQPPSMPNKNIWLILIILLNTIGPLLYFLMAPRGLQTKPTEENDLWSQNQ